MITYRYPYVGLRPFTKQEAHLLCGRDQQIALLKQKLKNCFTTETHLLAVLGVSGCGKSSVVKAGLLPQLQQDDDAWHIVESRPGSAPFYELAKGLLADSHSGFYRAYKNSLYVQADSDEMLFELLEGDLRQGSYSLHDLLARLTKTHPEDLSGLEPDGKYILLVDQFEELFRYNDDHLQGDTIDFVSLLLTAATHPTIAVILTMRPEYLEHCTQMEGLAEAISAGVYLLPRMSEDELEQAIRDPLDQQNYPCAIEDELVTQLLSAVSELPTPDEQPYYIPDRLPLLQHALYRSWLKAEARTTPQAKGVHSIADARNMQHATPIQIQLDGDYGEITQLSAKQIAPELSGGAQNELQEYLNNVDKQHDLANNPLQSALVHALEKLFYSFTPGNQQKLAKIFPALVEYDNVNQRLVRRVVRFAEICALFTDNGADYTQLQEELRQLLYSYRNPANHILTPPTHCVTVTGGIKTLALEPDTVLDISHEALIMYWPRLRDWAYLDAEDGALLRDLYKDALRWKTEHKQTFWTGDKLAAASQRVAELQPKRAWLSRYVADQPDVLDGIKEFLVQSKQFNDEQKDAKQRAQEATLAAQAAEIKAQESKLAEEESKQREQESTLAAQAAEIKAQKSKLAEEKAKRQNWIFALGSLSVVLLVIFMAIFMAHNGFIDQRATSDLSLANGVLADSTGQYSKAQQALLNAEQTYFGFHVLNEFQKQSVAFLQRKIMISSLTTQSSQATIILDKTQYKDIEPLSTLIITADGHYAITAGEKVDEGKNPSLYLLDLRDKTQSLSIDSGHFHNINALLFHPDGKQFFSAGDDGQLIQWQWNGLAPPTLLDHWWVDDVENTNDPFNVNKSNDIRAIALTADNQTILYATASGGIYKRDLTGGSEHWLYQNSNQSAINALIVNGNYLYAALADSAIIAIDLNKSCVDRLSGHTHSVESLALSKDGKTLASSGADGKIILWNTETLTPFRELNTRGDSMVNSLVFIDEDKRLVSGGDDFALRLWDVASGRILRVFEGHSGRVRGLATVAADDEQVCSVSNDRSLRCWEMTLSDYQQLDEKPAFTNLNNSTTAISADGRYVVLGSATGKLQVYDRETGNLSPPIVAHKNRISENTLIFSPDNQYLLSAGYDGKLKRRTWQAGQLGQVENIQEDNITKFGVISALRFSPDGQWLIAGNEKGSLAVLSGKDDSQYSTEQINEDKTPIVALSFDKMGRRLLVADSSRLHYYAFNNGKLNQIGISRALDKGSLWSAALSPDGRYAVAVGDTQVVNVFTLSESGLSEQAQTLRGHTEAILQAKFAPGGHLLTAGADATLRFWEIDRTRQLFSLELPSPPRPQLNAESPLLSFDFRCISGTKNCILAVPLNKRGALALYEF